METEIERHLEWNALIDDYLIDVSVEDGKAKLEGTVGSSAEFRQAGNLAWVRGIKEVDTSGLEAERWRRDPDLRVEPW